MSKGRNMIPLTSEDYVKIRNWNEETTPTPAPGWYVITPNKHTLVINHINITKEILFLTTYSGATITIRRSQCYVFPKNWKTKLLKEKEHAN